MSRVYILYLLWREDVYRRDIPQPSAPDERCPHGPARDRHKDPVPLSQTGVMSGKTATAIRSIGVGAGAYILAKFAVSHNVIFTSGIYNPNNKTNKEGNLDLIVK